MSILEAHAGGAPQWSRLGLRRYRSRHRRQDSYSQPLHANHPSAGLELGLKTVDGRVDDDGLIIGVSTRACIRLR